MAVCEWDTQSCTESVRSPAARNVAARKFKPFSAMDDDHSNLEDDRGHPAAPAPVDALHPADPLSPSDRAHPTTSGQDVDSSHDENSVETPLLLHCPPRDKSRGAKLVETGELGGPLSMRNTAQVQKYAVSPPWGPGSSFRRVQELCQWLGCLLLVKIDQCKFGHRHPGKEYTAKLLIGPKVGSYSIKIPNLRLFELFATTCGLWEHLVATDSGDSYLFSISQKSSMMKVSFEHSAS